MRSTQTKKPDEVIVFDVETTGLPANIAKLSEQPHIIEFYGAVVNLVTGRIKNELHCLIKPPVRIPDLISGLTGISNAVVKDAEPFVYYAGHIFKFLQHAKLAIAHHIKFDQQMINIEAKRIKYNVRWPRTACTMVSTMHLRGRRLSLTSLHKYLFDKPFVGPHRAKSDTTALIKCCVELRRRRII